MGGAYLICLKGDRNRMRFSAIARIIAVDVPQPVVSEFFEPAIRFSFELDGVGLTTK